MERENHSQLGLIVLSVIVVILAIATVFLFYRTQGVSTIQNDGEWKCGAVSCTKTIDPQAWVAKYCGLVSGPNSTNTVLCTLNSNGQNISVPLTIINMSFVAQQCEVVSCTQEIRVRAVNYTVNSSKN